MKRLLPLLLLLAASHGRRQGRHDPRDASALTTARMNAEAAAIWPPP